MADGVTEVNGLYRKLRVAKLDAGSDAVRQLEADIDQKWKDKAVSDLVSATVADPIFNEATYLLALTKHEQAERRQASGAGRQGQVAGGQQLVGAIPAAGRRAGAIVPRPGRPREGRPPAPPPSSDRHPEVLMRLVTDSPGRRAPVELTRDMTLVGRGEDCDLRIDHKSVSKQHCVLVKTEGLVLRPRPGQHQRHPRERHPRPPGRPAAERQPGRSPTSATR